MKHLGLPNPISEHGYSWKQLKECLSEGEYEKLGKWMYGQTCMLDETHGPIVYTHDAIRGIDLIRNGKPTYFD